MDVEPTINLAYPQALANKGYFYNFYSPSVFNLIYFNIYSQM